MSVWNSDYSRLDNNNENLILYFKYCLKASATVVRKPPNALYIPTPSNFEFLKYWRSALFVKRECQRNFFNSQKPFIL